MKSSRRALLATIGASALAGCSTVRDATGLDFERVPEPEPGADSWPAPGWGPRNRNANPEASIPESEPSLEWSTPLEKPSPPVVADRTVVVAEGEAGGLTALDTETGEERWNVEDIGESRHVSEPTVSDGRVYVGLGQSVAAFSLDDGSERWRASFGEVSLDYEYAQNATTPVVADGLLFVVADGGVMGVDAAGRVHHYTELERTFIPEKTVPAVVDDDVIATSPLTFLIRFDADPDPWQGPIDQNRGVPPEETQEWVRNVEDADIDPMIGDGVVYQSIDLGWVGENEYLIALGAGDGSERWSFETAGQVLDTTLLRGTLFVADSDGQLHAVDADDGGEQWSREGTGGSLRAGQNGIVTTGEEVVHLALDGTERWRLSTGQRPPISTVITDGRLYVLTGPNEPEGYLDYELRCYT